MGRHKKIITQNNESTITGDVKVETPVMETKKNFDLKPMIIVSLIVNGKRENRTYTCEDIRLHEYKDHEIKSTMKTRMTITLEANVLEVDK